MKKRNQLYELYHHKRSKQHKIIGNNNFTYHKITSILDEHTWNAKKVLDIGCGVGTLSFYLASKKKFVIGIDISHKATKRATRDAKDMGLSRYVKFYTNKFPTESMSGKFDTVVCSEILEHLKNDNLAIKKIHKLLKKDGTLIISVPSKNAPLFKMGLLTGFDKEVGHLRRYSQSDLVRLVSENGNFTIVDSFLNEGVLRNFLFTNKAAGKFVRFIKWRLVNLVTVLDQFSMRLFGESQIFLIARKK